MEIPAALIIVASLGLDCRGGYFCDVRGHARQFSHRGEVIMRSTGHRLHQ